MSDNPKKTSKTSIQLAIEMNDSGFKMNAIARELGVHPSTVRRWFKARGIPARNGHALSTRDEAGPSSDPLADELKKDLSDATKETIIQATHESRKKEDEAMLAVAEAQATPADKYQHYIAAAGIKLLRDSMKNLRGPKSVRELSELDQMIRRNLGLNAKSGSSKTVIDLTILNNRTVTTKKDPNVIDVDK